MMQELGAISKKFLKIACITSPFFGLLSATRGFLSKDFELQRELLFFLFATLFTFYLWMMNILLLWLNNKYKFSTNNIARFIVSGLLCLIAIVIIFSHLPPFTPKFPMPAMPTSGGMPMPMPHTGHQQHSSLARMILFPGIQAISINIIIVILIELLMLREIKNKVDIENEQLKLANLEARNSQLQQQLQPHFLFNSLTTLRSLINRSPEKAEDYLDKLAELLRYSTNNSLQASVTLQEEVELCTNYLNMQKTRFGEALNFTINVPEDLQKNGKVPTYALQQLAENAIKHNILTREQPLFIIINAVENADWILIQNNLQPKPAMEASTGVGLANLSERYKLLGNDDIVIKKEADFFSVSIKILGNAGNHY